MLFSQKESQNDLLFPSLSLSPSSLLWKDKKYINFSSHDYLGLSQMPQMRKNVIKYVLHYGTGLCHSEIKESYIECQRRIEERYAESLNLAQVHLVSSHSLALQQLADRFFDCKCTLFVDSRSWECIAFPTAIKLHFYSSLEELDFLLSSNKCLQKVIFSESLFETTGEAASIDTLVNLTKRHQSFLILDESSAFAVKGKQGLGLSADRDDIDFVLCSLDRGAGANAAFMGYSSFVVSHLPKKEFWHRRDYALTFSTLGAIEASLDLIISLEGERRQLQQQAHFMRQQLKSLNIIAASSHFISLPCEQAHQKYNSLLERGIVAELKESRLKNPYLLFMLNVHHSAEELSLLIHHLTN